MERFSHKDGCGICVPRCLKEELAWNTDKWFQLISMQNYTAYYTELQMNYMHHTTNIKLQLHYTTLRSLFWLLLHLLRYAVIDNEICQIPFTIKPTHYYSSLYLLCYIKGQMHVNMIASSNTIATSTTFLLCMILLIQSVI